MTHAAISGATSLLRDLVGAAQALLSEKHVLGRLGGDEFVVILSAEIEVAVAVAERLRKRVSERVVQYLNHRIQYTISVGVAGCEMKGGSFSDLLHKADLALYKAKQQGKNRIST